VEPERCELVPAALYVNSCPPAGIRVNASGGLDQAPLSVAPTGSCYDGEVFVTPDRTHVVRLRGNNGGQITFVHNIDPTTLGLEANTQSQPMETTGESVDFGTGAMFPGPTELDHDYLLVANEADAGNGGGGLYLFSFNRGNNHGAIAEIDRLRVDDPFSPVVHPSGRTVYYIENRGLVSPSIVLASFDTQSGMLAGSGSTPLSPTAGYWPQQLAVDESGEYLYVLYSDFVASFTIDDNRMLSTHSEAPRNSTNDLRRLAVHPAAGIVYAVGSSALFAFRAGSNALAQLDLDDNTVNGITSIPLTNGQDVAVDAEGRFLFVLEGQNARAFAVDQNDGKLTEIGSPVPQGGTRLAILHELVPIR
jgi:DNA-binding beta-propeller fold protein YncE